MSGGWLSPPVILGDNGGWASAQAGQSNITFRFAAVQLEKIRPCGDFKYGLVNLACANRAPIKLPTWGHIGQICLEVRDTGREWGFFKADRKAAYKNLPLNPDQAPLCTVALRNPTDSRWYGFLPRTLLFGAAAAVLRYNCFSRIIAALANCLFGLPVLNYFDDFGFPIPDSLSADGLGGFLRLLPGGWRPAGA